MTDGLTPDQRAILRHLEGIGNDSTLHMAELFGYTFPQTYDAIGALVRKGLVSATSNGRWKRAQQL